jgi:hypothetical protein
MGDMVPAAVNTYVPLITQPFSSVTLHVLYGE